MGWDTLGSPVCPESSRTSSQRVLLEFRVFLPRLVASCLDPESGKRDSDLDFQPIDNQLIVSLFCRQLKMATVKQRFPCLFGLLSSYKYS